MSGRYSTAQTVEYVLYTTNISLPMSGTVQHRL
jgi:hypothetical protein